jgi:hypothetical protein
MAASSSPSFTGLSQLAAVVGAAGDGRALEVEEAVVPLSGAWASLLFFRELQPPERVKAVNRIDSPQMRRIAMTRKVSWFPGDEATGIRGGRRARHDRRHDCFPAGEPQVKNP